jgi:hypothetical protein
MKHLPRDAMATPAGWSDLADELDRWDKAGRVAGLWWRDDDAAAVSDRLDRLAAIAGSVPIALAVIPAAADPGLAAWLACSSGFAPPLAVVQHGWRHVNYAVDGKKSEFPPGRSGDAVSSELAAGRARLTALFGTRALAVLAPPWNRFDASFLPLLAACGFSGISRVKPRSAMWPIPGVVEVNVHVDLVAWTGDRRFIGEEAALGGIVGHLRARRTGQVDAAEPTGILTHHLVQDEPTETFLRRFLAFTNEHPAARWLDAAGVFFSTF